MDELFLQPSLSGSKIVVEYTDSSVRLMISFTFPVILLGDDEPLTVNVFGAVRGSSGNVRGNSSASWLLFELLSPSGHCDDTRSPEDAFESSAAFAVICCDLCESS
jgi:hypothetical protein